MRVSVKSNVRPNRFRLCRKLGKPVSYAEKVTVDGNYRIFFNILIRFGLFFAPPVIIPLDADKAAVGITDFARIDIPCAVAEEKNRLTVFFPFNNPGKVIQNAVAVRDNKHVHSYHRRIPHIFYKEAEMISTVNIILS